MGMGTPGYVLPGTIGPLEQQQQQNYLDQFNSAPYAPIPGVGAGQPQGATASPFSPQQSQWNSLNGRLLGDTYLPPDVNTVDVGNGWYEVHHGGQRVGTLRPGGPNGRFLNDTNWQMPLPGLVGGAPAGGAPAIGPPGGMPPQAQAFNANGRFGTQAMQMAGLLAQQPTQPPPGGGGGLLGGPKQGFRIPGGK